ncbi:MAG: PEGA domain-containing protein, partial [Myxococcota bacterium]
RPTRTPAKATRPARAEAPAPDPTTTAPKAATGSGKLTLQTKPWGRIILDGVDTGKFTPVVEMPVTAGTRRVEVVNDRLGKRVELVVRVGAGETVKESRALE